MCIVKYYMSPLGRIMLASEDGFLTGVWFEGAKYFAGTLDPKQMLEGTNFVLEHAAGWLDAYFQDRRPNPSDLPIRLSGSPFRKSVLSTLLCVPYGETTTYGAIAHSLEHETGKSVSAQAVGGAVGHNPVSVIIPCHRVIGSDGSLTGYAGGLERKRQLLLFESGLTHF